MRHEAPLDHLHDLQIDAVLIRNPPCTGSWQYPPVFFSRISSATAIGVGLPGAISETPTVFSFLRAIKADPFHLDRSCPIADAVHLIGLPARPDPFRGRPIRLNAKNGPEEAVRAQSGTGAGPPVTTNSTHAGQHLDQDDADHEYGCDPAIAIWRCADGFAPRPGANRLLHPGWIDTARRSRPSAQRIAP